MKLLPCAVCGIAKAGEPGPLVAFEHGVRRGPGRDGLPYYLETFPGRPVFKYRCSVCGSAREMTAMEFAAIPDATAAQLEECGVLAHVARDHTLGGKIDLEEAKGFFLLGVRVSQTEDLHAAGLTADELAAMPLPERRG